MPYQVSWLIENRIMLARHYGVLSNDDLVQYLEESFEMRDKANEINGDDGPLIHTITDATQLKSQDIALSSAREGLKQLRTQRVGWSVYINDDKITRLMASIAHQFVGVRYRAFGTMTQGTNFLQQNDNTLPPIPTVPPFDPKKE